MTGAGAEARRYLEKRGLTRETIAAFRLGYAPNDRAALSTHLANAGFKVEEMIASGMLIGGDDIPVAYDRFRHRVTFPITDLRGRVIAFGGRALDADAPAKYLNSPDTPLFHKGQILFNAHARAGPRTTRIASIAVEGYMDVIALTEAGFGETVAPLGTALTEEQVKLLWRMADEPILCFDGDAAGRKAAFRAVETALPLLKPGFSVRFAFLPGGLDPDDLVRQQGPQAFADELAQDARPVRRPVGARGAGAGSVDARAARRLRGPAQGAWSAKIGDATVRSHYESELRETLWALNRTVVREIARGQGPRKGAGGAGRRNNIAPDWRVRERARLGQSAQIAPQRRSNASPRAGSPGRTLAPAREALLIKTLLNHPWLIDEHAEEIAAMTYGLRPPRPPARCHPGAPGCG